MNVQDISVQKRDGRVVPYTREKIRNAMNKAFVQYEVPITDQALDDLVRQVEDRFHGANRLTVEAIQDKVELVLMEEEYFTVAKGYILYREERRKKRSARSKLESYFPELPELHDIFLTIEDKYTDPQYDLSRLLLKFESFYKTDRTADERLSALTHAAIELTDEEGTRWEFIASYFYDLAYKRDLADHWQSLIDQGKVAGAGEAPGTIRTEDLTFAQKIRAMESLGLYCHEIASTYSEEELNRAAQWLDMDRDFLLNYSGYDLLVNRYVVRTHNLLPLENLQEMYLGIALFLAIPEKKEDRMDWVHRFYNMLSTLKVTMATPTLSNARKPFHQLSSCFIDTVPDDLQGIYKSISNFANVSKFGGGMGLYFGKVRAQGSTIRGFKGAAGGVIRWVRLANDTAVAVDQLGVRQGACACYLDVWHKDVPEFLQIRTNNGDDRMKAHDIFPAICYPDYFWQQVETNMEGQWGLLDPHEVLTKKGYALEDSYGQEWTQKYLDCMADETISKRWIPIKEMVRLIIRSLVETGTPFAFNRDAVNRANPNKDKGMIYCSNLCTEIAQNMSPSTIISEEIDTEDGDPIVVTKMVPGDYVVCNLASLNLGKIDVQDPAEMEEVTTASVRALDNVIEMNYFPVSAAKVNNANYRPIGLGVSGYHHMLANNHIFWESEDHLTFVDRVFEDINYYAIKASMENAKDKGAYPYFKGSDWDTGAYFTDRGYHSDRWTALAAQVHDHGLRNGYLLAVAPTSSTSIVAGTSPGVDPIMNRFYYDEKKNGLIPRVAPDLSLDNLVYYKPAHQLDQSWLIRSAGIRTRHIDQATSMNLYITNDYTFREILSLYLDAYHEGVKTVYYIRSKSLEVEECESCAL
ncbi:ribonucleoside-diphosphate reductase subunit alpha [Kallipyga gabonensis]|uniref:ribonucleoside-diphosphate reductase subunit alpha n=1 Tax=Kallipyga gabonensis TaxID=1686287 RepID=UPI000A58A13D|nr:ribonucleoside-diphosphate reductase subunit alpha [Kallipyga gabonensis]